MTRHYFFAKRYLPELRPELRGLIMRGLVRAVAGARPEHRSAMDRDQGAERLSCSDSLMCPVPRVEAALPRARWSRCDRFADRRNARPRFMVATRARSPTSRGSSASGWRSSAITQTSGCSGPISTQRAYSATPEPLRCRLATRPFWPIRLRASGRMLEWLECRRSVRTRFGAAVEKRAFSAIPSDQKGPGKRARSATPGQWKERLSTGEVELVEKLWARSCKSFGYEVGSRLQSDPA